MRRAALADRLTRDLPEVSRVLLPKSFCLGCFNGQTEIVNRLHSRFAFETSMNRSRVACLVWTMVLLWPAVAFGQLNVLNSGGFAGPYRELLPAFERNSGLTVTSTQGASQSTGPNYLSQRFFSGVGLMTGDHVQGRPHRAHCRPAEQLPERSSTWLRRPWAQRSVEAHRARHRRTGEAFKQAVLRAKSVNLVSTTGLYLTEKIFPSLGIAAEVARKTKRGQHGQLGQHASGPVLRPVSDSSICQASTSSVPFLRLCSSLVCSLRRWYRVRSGSGRRTD